MQVAILLADGGKFVECPIGLRLIYLLACDAVLNPMLKIVELLAKVMTGLNARCGVSLL